MPSSVAFHAALAALPKHQKSQDGTCSRAPFRAALYSVDEGIPYVRLIAAGVSLGIAGATFENMLQVVYKGRQNARQPSDDELCEFCSGFGTVRCELCGSRGVLTILGTSKLRTCPVCKGNKRERCRRCAGSGKSGMKKQVR